MEVPVFIDTSLGTHIATSVPPYIKTVEFKRKLEEVHSNCFPELGTVKFNGLMVKRKAYFYHLPESLPINHVFQGSKRTWFMYIEASPSNTIVSPTHKTKNVHSCLSEKRAKKNHPKWKRSKRVSKSFHLSKKRKKDAQQDLKERLSESVSVSGIIKKYFSIHDEVTSISSKVQNDKRPKYAPKTPPVTASVVYSRNDPKSSGVGKRVIVAAKNLGLSQSDRKPMVSLCKYRCNESLLLNSNSLVRSLVFEME